MRRILAAIAVALACASAVATERERHTPPARHQHQSATADSGSTSSATSTASPITNAYGGAMGDTRVIALPGGGGGAPSVTCVSWRWYGWGAYGSQDPDLDCVRLLAQLERLRLTPMPVQEVRSYLDAPPTPAAAQPPAAAAAAPQAAQRIDDGTRARAKAAVAKPKAKPADPCAARCTAKKS